MELRHLAAFTAVAEEGSFTAAARRLHMVQSAVSATVRALERELDVRLFDRTPHRVQLTSAGRLLLPEARRTLAAAAAARDVIAQAHGGLRGTVRLGILQWHRGFSLPRLIAEFRAEHPHVEIELHRGDSTSHVAALHKGQLDLAFLAVDPDVAPGLSLLRLVGDTMAVVTSPDHRLAGRTCVDLAATADEPFAETPPTWGLRMSNDRAFRAAGVERRVAFEVADVATVLDFVRCGLAVAIVPSWVLDSTSGVCAMPIRSGAPVLTISLATVAQRDVPAPCRALMSTAWRLAGGTPD
ncbi:LysR family transcriptional regulator [Pseudonocardia alaniniphila]|uniref:LysR family transcriptional regulator n=1 Tax=Pseudonocardia alaniniphila TaxID=75291 RepID=A0ABS9TNY1_9PSEU|nr:LysR family transcriptional regulator [Pseudonocardia alaniniphila]MCH6170255.1 LysR family transcriptional regulator [Pseudonocardia alaniniphila]